MIACNGGCGRLNFESVMTDGATDGRLVADTSIDTTFLDAAVDRDASLDGSGTSDAEMDAALELDPRQPFSNLQLMPGVRLRGDDPTLTGDMLEIVYEGPARDLYVSRRGALAEGWGEPTLLAELNSPEWESTPEMTYDGLTIYFASDRSGQRLIYRSTRQTRLEPWLPPMVVSELQSAGLVGLDCAATPMADGGGLLAGVKGEMIESQDIRLFERTGTTWAELRLLDEINSTAIDAGPFLAGPNVIYFSSSRDGARTDAIFRAIRATAEEPFGTPEKVSEFDLPMRQIDPWLSPDVRTIVFASDHDGQGLGFYQAVR